MNSLLLPSALVIQWYSRSLRVRRPYCDDSHDHSPGQQALIVQKRQADCGAGQYALVYPPKTYENEIIGWEFDRRKVISTQSHLKVVYKIRKISGYHCVNCFRSSFPTTFHPDPKLTAWMALLPI